MRGIFVIVRREVGGYFGTPVALVFLLAFLFLSVCAMYFWGSFFVVDEASLRAYFYWLPFILAMFVPAVGMRLWCEERRQQTLELLLTMPITLWQAVIGKYVAGVLFLVIGLLLTFPMAVTVAILGAPDYGVMATGYLGGVLLSSALLSVSSLLSSLTANQVISYVSSAVLSLLLVLGGHQSTLMFVRQWFGNGRFTSFVSWLSVSRRFEAFQFGIVDAGDCVYLLSLSLLFLFLTERALEWRRGK